MKVTITKEIDVPTNNEVCGLTAANVMIKLEQAYVDCSYSEEKIRNTAAWFVSFLYDHTNAVFKKEFTRLWAKKCDYIKQLS